MTAQTHYDFSLDSLVAAAYASETASVAFALGAWDKNYALYGSCGTLSNTGNLKLSVQYAAESTSAAWRTLLTLGTLTSASSQTYAFETATNIPKPLMPYARIVATVEGGSAETTFNSIVAKFLTDK